MGVFKVKAVDGHPMRILGVSRMNKTYKVARSMTRGTVVTSEVASSRQGKALKMVVAAVAAAFVGGVAMAEESTTDLWKGKVVENDITIVKDTKINSAVLKSGTITVKDVGVSYDGDNSKGDFEIVGGTVSLEGSKDFTVRDFAMNGGAVKAVGASLVDEAHGRTAPAFGAYHSFVMESGSIELSKSGRIWIGTSWGNDPSSYARMELKGGTVTLTEGGYITGNKRYVQAGDYEDSSLDLKWTVSKDTLGYNIIGFDGATVKVTGEGNVIDAVGTELTAGSLTLEGGGLL